MDDNKLVVVDENGKEIEMEILFTFEDDHRQKKYVVYFDPQEDSEEQTLFSSIYDDEGRLFPIETDEEWDMVEEVVGAFMQEEEDEEEEEEAEEEGEEEEEAKPKSEE